MRLYFIASPTQTTSYTVTGSGVDLCTAQAVVQVYVRAGTVTANDPLAEQVMIITPNPSDGQMQVSFTSPLRGALTLAIRNLNGAEIVRQTHQKNTDTFEQSLNLQSVAGGVYFVEVRIGDQVFRKRVVKN
ncbi:T9SS type A sorting domain-containing protein [Spirosoma sp. SC4-14]|uniref:T9SS type A sorting domain-containing protein n=1 Tax=Spirosoma sp. SC4-14 TaxID=3128900 RepID=UPI0030D50E4B